MSIIPPNILSLRGFPIDNVPYTNITPLTIRDTASLLGQLESVKRWLNELSPELDDRFQLLIDAWATQAQTIIDAVINDSVELQDAVIAALLQDEDSSLSIELNTRLQTVIQEKPDDPGVFMINRSPLPSPESGELIPDPDNPGYWIVGE